MDSSSLLELVLCGFQRNELLWDGSVVHNRCGQKLALSVRGRTALERVFSGTVSALDSLERAALFQLIAFYLLNHGRLAPIVDYSSFMDESNRAIQPAQVSTEITKLCNLSCLHCYNDSGKRDPQELSDGEKLEMVRYLGRWGVRRLNVTGGEPVLDSSFPALLSLAGEYGMKVVVTTNGWKVPTELLAAIDRGTVAHVNLSLDGADEATHDAFRGRQGSYKRALLSMQTLSEFRPQVLQLNASIHTISVHQMQALAGLALRYRFDSVSFKPVTSSGRHDGRVDFLLSLEDLQLYQRERSRLAALYAGQLRVEGNILGGAVPTATLDHIVCNAGERSMLILANGKMTPCAALNADTSAPDVRTVSPMEAWLTHPLFQDFRSMKRAIGRVHVGCPGSRFASVNSSSAAIGLRILQ